MDTNVTDLLKIYNFKEGFFGRKRKIILIINKNYKKIKNKKQKKKKTKKKKNKKKK